MSSITIPLTGTVIPFGGPAPTGPAIAVPTAPGVSSSDNGDSSWLSGLGDVFSAVGSSFASAYKAVNTPSPVNPGSGWQYNPATGQYYNPITGQAMTATGTLTSAGGFAGALGGSNMIILILIAVVAIFAFKRRGSE